MALHIFVGDATVKRLYSVNADELIGVAMNLGVPTKHHSKGCRKPVA